MKKFLSIFVATFIVFFGSLGANASAASVTTSLGPTETTDTTSRITLGSGQKLTITVGNYWYSDHTIKWTIFKNGSAYLSGLRAVNGTTQLTYTTADIGTGQYSLRLYCGTYGGLTGCEGQGTLSVN